MTVRWAAVLALMAFAGSGQTRAESGGKPAAPPPAKPAAAPVSQNDAPQRTSATYDNWVVACELRKASPPEKACEIAQVSLVQGRNIPFTRIAIPGPVKSAAVRLVVQTPVNVLIAKNVRIKGGDPAFELSAPFTRCVPSGCFAEFEVKDDEFKKMHANTGAGQMAFTDSAGQEIVVPVAFKGLAQAFEALARE